MARKPKARDLVRRFVKPAAREGADPDHCPCCQARLIYYRQIIAGQGIDPIAVAIQISVWFEDPDAMAPSTRSDAFDAAWKGRRELFARSSAEKIADARRLGIVGETLDDLKFQIARAEVGSRPEPVRRAS